MKQGFATVQPWLSLLARIGLVVVWVWAGWAKFVDPRKNVLTVRSYRILPEALVTPFAYAQPALELLVALVLLLGIGTRLAAIVSCVLLLMFITGIASVWARGISIDCGCFGGGGPVAKGSTNYLGEILRDIGFLILAAFLAWQPFSRLSLDATLGVTSPRPGVLAPAEN